MVEDGSRPEVPVCWATAQRRGAGGRETRNPNAALLRRSSPLAGAVTNNIAVDGSAPAGAASGTWKATGSMTIARENHTATALPDGRVLVAGGDCCGTAELYDPTTGVWSATGSMTTARARHTATRLPGGQLSSAEVYFP